MIHNQSPIAVTPERLDALEAAVKAIGRAVLLILKENPMEGKSRAMALLAEGFFHLGLTVDAEEITPISPHD